MTHPSSDQAVTREQAEDFVREEFPQALRKFERYFEDLAQDPFALKLLQVIVAESEWSVNRLSALRNDYLALPKWKRPFYPDTQIFSVREPANFDLVPFDRILYLLGTEEGKGRDYVELVLKRLCETELLEGTWTLSNPITIGGSPRWKYAYRPSWVARFMVRRLPPIAPSV